MLTRIQACAFPARLLLLLLALFCRDPGVADAAAMEADAASMLLYQVNQVRQQHDTPPVRWNAQLALAAQGHARDLQSCNRLSHTGCDGSDLRQRLDRAGYSWRMAAENLALCACDTARVVGLWMESDGHRRNLLNTDAKEIGGAALQDRDGNDVWVLVLGAAR